MSEEMRRDERVFLMGEEVAEYNGAYKVSRRNARCSLVPNVVLSTRPISLNSDFLVSPLELP